MAKHIMQFRYYGDGHKNNQPVTNEFNNQLTNAISKMTLLDGTVFADYLPFTQLGIQSLPGTRFYLNDNIESPIIIGSTGIYEINVDGISQITSLKFDGHSLALIEDNSNAYLIIDVIYEK